MPETRLIDTHLILPPEPPMRRATLLQNLGELIQSIAEKGLIHPIAVRDQADGTYQIIAGHRRYLAHVELGKKQIRCDVYAAGEGDNDEIRGTENLIRNAVDPVEEAEFYRLQRDKHGLSVTEIARRYNRSYGHVAECLNLLEGSADVLEALADGKINKAQASAINKIKDDIGRYTALNYARENGFTARAIDTYRIEREKSGVDVSMQRVAEVIQEAGPPSMRSQMLCQFCQNWHELGQVQVWQVCKTCQGGIARGIELLTEAGENT